MLSNADWFVGLLEVGPREAASRYQILMHQGSDLFDCLLDGPCPRCLLSLPLARRPPRRGRPATRLVARPWFTIPRAHSKEYIRDE